MHFWNRFRLPLTGILAASFCLTACGGDSSSSVDDPVYVSSAGGDVSSGAVALSSAASQPGSSPSATSSAAASVVKSSSSAATETVSGNEALNAAQKVVAGSCGPTASTVDKGELVTWKFYRSTGDVFDQILAPFVWTFEGTSNTNVQGNGLDVVNVRYADAGSFAAYLNVDGNDVACDPVQVQGIPIVVNSCVANVATAKAGETITWTADATSESAITGYEWSASYEGATVTGNGATATMVAASSMHKQKVSVTVAVSNADNSKQTYACEGVDVIDPNFVDLVLPLGSINAEDYGYGSSGLVSVADSLVIPSQTATTVQIPTGAPSNCTVGCKPVNSADYNSVTEGGGIQFGDSSPSNFAYFSPAGCASGVKYIVTTPVAFICVVNSQ